ncbi:hypothetical protein ASPZODRAFT_126765 [Penicilliopsis zonata CBS 506.65]|uniref:Ribosomal protein S12 n=1 Tax=Penicilliopsis zonata CBS 506.65 TaxID=1073090 RepID=A0A1L9SUR6_9EURO|nr:hypothetical protein ASPZODRAFT_126765 [Penicilliopsis zonata CBS 506.65]OJJ50817.1 hypothetical protein ASPZODRAFT_126765 [Penicilliopsis zonata CBS 506.65]
MPPFSTLALRALRTLVPAPSTRAVFALPKPQIQTPTLLLHRSRPSFHPVLRSQSAILAATTAASARCFSSTPSHLATYNQVRRGCRKSQRTRRSRSPALAYMPQLKGVCLKTGITKPKKPNSGERKTARIRLSTGKVITAYIPGEGHNVQQHSVVLVRGGRAQDCPGVKYTLVRGSMDLGGVGNRLTSRSKYGTKKPKKD